MFVQFLERESYTGTEKLKGMSVDRVSYIQIETEAIRDFNDKQMISSYCLSKLELVNWYLELLEVGSKKYIVPQSMAYLENVREEPAECHKQIMKTQLVFSKNVRFWISNMPKGMHDKKLKYAKRR